MGRGELFGAKLLALEFNLGLLFLSGNLQAAAADELNDAAQLIAIEPSAVAFADVYDDARAMGKIDPVHQDAALWTGNIANAFQVRRPHLMRRRRRGGAQYGGLLFAIGADLFKRRHLDPETDTVFAFTHGHRAQGDRRHVNLAPRTLQYGEFGGGC